MTRTLGVILAGGLARRMGGGDKPLRTVGCVTILERVIARLAPQVDALIINANGDPARFARLGLPVVPDDVPEHPGPLAGVLAAMGYAAERGFDDVVSTTGDSPFIPSDLAARLSRARDAAGVPLARAASGGFDHPPIGLWPLSLHDELRRAVIEEDLRRVFVFGLRFGCATAEWPAEPFDPFFNANTPEDLDEAEGILARHPGA